MKKLLLITLLGIFTSCGISPTNVENPTKITTIQIQQLANADTTVYKVVELDGTVYILSEKDNLVMKKVSNLTGTVETLALILFLVMAIGFVLLAILTD